MWKSIKKLVLDLVGIGFGRDASRHTIQKQPLVWPKNLKSVLTEDFDFKIDPAQKHYIERTTRPVIPEQITMSRGPLCCNDCDSILVATPTGGYWCGICHYSPSIQDTYIRKWDDG